MYKKAFGVQRQELFKWLEQTWLKEGPVICFIEGFPGVGKTALAGDLCETAKKNQGFETCFEEVTSREDPSLTDLFIDLAANLSSHCHQPEMEVALLAEGDMNLARSLDRALRNEVLIVVDDIQRFFKPDTGEPKEEIEHVLASISSKNGHRGRLLLLSDRLLVQGRWSAEIAVKRLDELEQEEAGALLDDRLSEANIPEAVPPERKSDLVQALGRNPRAIETLVSTLAFESLDEVVGRHPGFWSIEDRNVSRDFIKRLEKDLLERSISRLSPEHYRKLLLLSVHRKNFEQPVFQVLCEGKRAESRQLAHALVTHFLLKHIAGWYSVQTLVREIGLAHLKEHEGDFKQAHARAAEYYARPLKSRDLTGFNSRLVNSFAEARYHLYQAGKNEELKQLLVQMMDVALAEMNTTSQVPSHPEGLNERIEILTILLEEQAPPGLHYYMARCLKARQHDGDLPRAIEYARRATSARRAPADAWVLLAKLLKQSGNSVDAIKTIYRALDSVPVQDKRFALYDQGASILAGAGRTSDALILLQDGILNVQAEKNLGQLYLKAAEIYVGQHRSETAIGLLREGIMRIPSKQYLIALYRALTQVLINDGRIDEASDLVTSALSENKFDGIDLDIARELLKNVQHARETSPGHSLRSVERSLPAQERSTSGASKSGPVLSKCILVIATEWVAKQGGLSTFNRELCTSLAKLGHRVTCVIPEIQEGEVEAAKEKHVQLVAASPVSGADSLSGLVRKLPLRDFEPDIIIGHGRITGNAAKVQREDSFPNAKRIHFVHMAPGEIEWYKGKKDAAQSAEQREEIELELCKDADLIAAVGPRLYLEFGNLLHALEHPPRLHQYIPALRGIPSREPAPGLLCLVLGRAEDLELKGLDIAALAMAKVLESSSEFESIPELVVRGAPKGTGTELREKLRQLVNPSDLSIRVKEYSANVDTIEQDIRRASVVLMPSRREGFGLVPLEALQAGTPVLVSSKSGFAEFLKTKITSSSQLQQYVVKTVDDAHQSADEWAKAIEFVLRDRKAAFRRTVDLNEVLGEHTWEASSATLVSTLVGSDS